MTARFTLDGDDSLESHLAEICADTKKGLRSLIPDHVLQGIALGGGYGRGEGGVLRTTGNDKPYNDVEFFVFLKGQKHILRRQWSAAIRELELELTGKHGIEVEMRLLGSKEMQKAKPSMFYYDLLRGHHWVLGDNSLFTGAEHHAEAGNLPLSEATRLLMNRSSGLLFAKERLLQDSFSSEDADFVFRNLSKAQLALGDAILTSRGRYHWSCRKRHVKLRAMGLDESIIRHHADGVRFKLHPTRPDIPRSQLKTLHHQVSRQVLTVFLEIESRRLNTTLTDPQSYLLSSPKCPESPAIRNRLINFRDRGLNGMWDAIHPREHLLNQLCSSLWCHPGKPLKTHQVETFTALWHSHG